MCRPVLTFYLLLSTDTAAETAQLRWRCRDKANCFFFSFSVGECVQLNRRGRLADADTRVDAVAGVFWRKFGFEHRETDKAPLDIIPPTTKHFYSRDVHGSMFCVCDLIRFSHGDAKIEFSNYIY